jgi:hypothetical protein
MTIEVEVEAPAAITVVLPVGGRTVTLPRPRTRHRRKAAFPLAGELNRVVRRTAQIRLLLSLLLAAAACPALVSIGWRQLFTAAGPVPLIIPVAAATALALGRVRPAPGEPDVHDRQVDGLLAAGFLGAAAALLLRARLPVGGRDPAAGHP